jgi:hypothetical protein
VFRQTTNENRWQKLVGRQDVMLSALGRSERFKLGLSVLHRNFPFKQYLSNTKRYERDYSVFDVLTFRKENFPLVRGY